MRGGHANSNTDLATLDYGGYCAGERGDCDCGDCDEVGKVRGLAVTSAGCAGGGEKPSPLT